MVLYWVVQRNAHTGALITFLSFADYADALRHKVELDEIAEGNLSQATIEALPVPKSPR